MPSIVRKNITYLTLSQGANYILPLITIPYISRTIGVENYGLVEYATVTVMYFITLVEYSFDLTGTRKMARIKNNPEKVILLFNSIFFSKLFLFLIATLIFSTLLFAVPSFAQQKALFIAAYLMVSSYVIAQNWFFQGMQKLGVVALANVSVKLIFTILIFTIIRTPKDYILVPLSSAAGFIIVAVIMLQLAFRQVPGMKLKYPGVRAVRANLRDGFTVFSSSMLNKLYALSGMLWAGFLLTDTDLGQFGAAHKLFLVIQGMMFLPIHGAVFPHMATKVGEGYHAYIATLKKIAGGMLALYGSALVVLIFAAPIAVRLLFGDEFDQTAQIFQWFIPSLIIGIGLNLFMYQGLLALNRDNWFFRIILFFAVFSLAGNGVALEFFGPIGAAVFRSSMDALFTLVSGILFFKALKSVK